MNKYFNKASRGVLKILGKSIITVAKVSPPVISGVSQFVKELGSNSYYVVHGNKKKQKLIKKLNKQNIQFSLKRMKFKSNHEFADACIISGLTAIHQFCSIGNHAFVTGGSLVRKDVPPYVKAAREPLSYVGINSVGLRRRGYDSEKIREIQNIYRLLYQKNYNNSQACAIIEAEMEASDERDEILMFIKNSHRGIMKGYTKSN